MYRMLSLAITALAALASATKPQICDEADISWNGPTGPFDLDASKVANITTRSTSLRHVWTREHVVVEPGKGEDVVVNLDVKLSDSSLQDAVSVVHKDNTVVVIFDTTDFDDFYERQCIVATVTVHIPKSLEHLILDVDNSAIDIFDISSTFKKLEILGKNGATRFHDSNLDIENFSLIHHNGAFMTRQSTIKAKTTVLKSQNGAVAARFAGSPIQSLDVDSHNGPVDLVIIDADDTAEDITSKITTTSANGRIGIKSYLKGPLDLTATSTNGRIATEIYNSDTPGTFHAQTRIGHASVEGDVKITKAQKSITGSLFEGSYGTPPASDASSGSTIDLDVSIGSLTLSISDEARDGSTVEPSVHLDGDEGGDDDDDDWFDQPPHNHHHKHHRYYFSTFHILSTVVVVVLLSGLTFHLVKRYRTERAARRGYVSI